MHFPQKVIAILFLGLFIGCQSAVRRPDLKKCPDEKLYPPELVNLQDGEGVSADFYLQIMQDWETCKESLEEQTRQGDPLFIDLQQMSLSGIAGFLIGLAFGL